MRGATSRATARIIASIALPTEDKAICPGWQFRAGAPDTRVIDPPSVTCYAPYRTTFAYPQSLSKEPL